MDWSEQIVMTESSYGSQGREGKSKEEDNNGEERNKVDGSN